LDRLKHELNETKYELNKVLNNDSYKKSKENTELLHTKMNLIDCKKKLEDYESNIKINNKLLISEFNKVIRLINGIEQLAKGNCNNGFLSSYY
jgi:hypothetical protein